MGVRTIITGSTGMVGKGVLLECLENPLVEKVLALNRHSLNLHHPKLSEILVKDFNDLSILSGKLRDFNACFFCLGVSSAGMKDDTYRKITYDLTLNFAQMLLKECKDLTFCYVSGAGTDSSEKGRMMWARIKGKTENDLLSLPFKAAYMFRPGFIEAKKGVRSRTRLYKTLYFIFRPLYFILRSFPSILTSTENLGKAMINCASKGASDRILETKDINLIGNAES